MAATNKKSANYIQNWRRCRRYIAIEHNQQVSKWFRVGTSSARTNLANSIRIYAKDTAPQMQAKMAFFKQYIDVENLLALPLIWQTNLMPGIPQLAIIFKPVEKKNYSRYTLHIPHYNGNRSPNITSHTNGNFWGIYKLKDGSKLNAYGSSETEVSRTIREMMRYVGKKWLPDTKKIATGYMPHEPFKRIKLKPIRADYFPEGRKNNPYSEWSYYF